MLKRLGRELKRKVTLIVIPHNRRRPSTFECSVAFLIFLTGLWTGITLWAGYLSGRHVDYWTVKAQNRLLRTKANYLARELTNSWELIEQAKRTEEEMRSLIASNPSGKEMSAGETALLAQNAIIAIHQLQNSPLSANLGPAQREIHLLRSETRKQLNYFEELTWSIANQKNLDRSTPVTWPAEGRFTSRYGYRLSPLSTAYEFHHGVDIANEPGTPVKATAEGVVRHAGWVKGYGRMVLVDHGFGYSTLYGHTEAIAVNAGDLVKRGQTIAYMGSTGRSTGEHLHYEVWQQGRPMNPLKLVRLKDLQHGVNLAATNPVYPAGGMGGSSSDLSSPSELQTLEEPQHGL